MNRQEHVQWCKNRALEYLKPGPYYSLQKAVASMASDMTKHPDTQSAIAIMGMIGVMEIARGEDAVRKWITGFN